MVYGWSQIIQACSVIAFGFAFHPCSLVPHLWQTGLDFSAPACRQAMIPGRLAWLAKTTVRHGNKIAYLSRITAVTTTIMHLSHSRSAPVRYRGGVSIMRVCST